MAAFAFVLYAPSILNGYAFDDHQAILRHPAVLGEVPLWEIFVREYWGRPIGDGWSSSYRPLTTLTFALEHRVTAAPWLHHLGNTVVYAVLCGVLVRFARRWCAPPVAVGCGLLFAALPVHVESVAGIVGRADLLAALASLLALDRALVRVPDEPAPGWPRAAAAGALYLVALLCKESVALLPVLGLWLGWVTVRPRTRAQWLRLTPIAVLAAVGGVYVLARNQILGVGLPPDFNAADNLLLQRDGLLRTWGKLAVLGHYAELTLVPLRLCADHTYADVIPPVAVFERNAVWAWVGCALVAWGMFDLVRALRAQSPGLVVATAIAYALVGHWIIDLSVIVAERLLLWPTVWLALATGSAVDRRLLPDRSRRHRIAVLGGALVALLAVRSVDRSLDWRDSETLHRSSLRACPRAVHSRFILANVLRERGQAEEAVWHYAVAGAGRNAFPGPFEVEALEVEETLPLSERLRRLPELVGAEEPRLYWASFHWYLLSQGAVREAEIVRGLAVETSPP